MLDSGVIYFQPEAHSSFSYTLQFIDVFDLASKLNAEKS